MALREGGTYRITFRVEILARNFKNGREIRKMGQKLKNSPLRGEYVFFRRRPVLSSACPVGPRGGGIARYLLGRGQRGG